MLPDHPPELLDYDKLLLTDAKRHGLEIHQSVSQYRLTFVVSKFQPFWSSSLSFT